MDKRTIYNIVRRVRVVDFFDYIYGYTQEIDLDIFKVCRAYYDDHSNLKKDLKKIQKDALKGRADKLYYHAKNVEEPYDEHYMFLQSNGIVFEDGNTAEQIRARIKRDNYKLNKILEDDRLHQLNNTQDEEIVFMFEENLIGLEMGLEMNISRDISVVEYLIYQKMYKQKSDGRR